MSSTDNDKRANLQAQGLKQPQKIFEILEMVAKGKTYKEIGKKLGLTEQTVKYHMKIILTDCML